MLWNKISNGATFLYSEGIHDFLNCPQMAENFSTALNESNAWYWMGYRDAEQIKAEGLEKTLTTNEAIYNHCN